MLAWTIPFSYLQSICSWAMFARGRERALVAPQALLILLFVPMLYYGIRWQGGAGAAWATVAAACLNYLLFLPLVFSLGQVQLVRWLWRPFAACAVASMALLLPAPWPARAAAFLAVYGGLIGWLDVLRPSHLKDGLRGIRGG